MFPSFASRALIAASLSLAGGAQAQTARICFDPGVSRLSPSGYEAIRTLAAAQGGTAARPHIRLFTPDSPVGDLVADRLLEAEIEFAMNGVYYARIQRSGTAESVDPDCLTAEVARDGSYFTLIHFNGPFFDSGSATVSPAARRWMRQLVPEYIPGVTRFVIEGYADAAGPADVNLDLSRRRAENVGLELVRLGVRWADLDLRWWGELRLSRPTRDGVGEPINRRVNIETRRWPVGPAR
ncbi:MAG TPA: OmpA family protein [Brevundimonas sp.]|nr:OmpA family protein [Brevundimonas sp.]